MNIVIYARFSSHAQNEQSIEGQLKECYAFAQKNDHTVIGEYIDRALSGTSDNRPQFQKMIEDSNGKTFQGVLVYQLDRFARDRHASAIYKHALKKNGVRVFSARENITDDASGVLVEGLLEAMAEYFSRELSQKVKRGMRLTAEKCLYTGSAIPLGYKINAEKHFEVDENTSAVVKHIFKAYADGATVIEIINSLNAKNIKTTRGNDFNKNSLHRMLKNKKYIGIYAYDDIIVKDGVPRIISDELFFKVQEIMKKNKAAPARARAKEEYILTTKLFCGHCKEMMTGYCGTSRTGKTYHYYICGKAKKKLCDKKAVNKQWIEDLIVAKCREILTDDNIAIIAKAVEKICNESDNSGINSLKKLLKDNERKQTNIRQAIAECDLEGIRKPLYDDLNKLLQSQREIEKEIATAEVGVIRLTYSQVKFFLSQIKNGNEDDIKYKKMLIAILINAIYLYDDKITIIFNAGERQVDVDISLLTDIEDEAECSFNNSIGVP